MEAVAIGNQGMRLKLLFHPLVSWGLWAWSVLDGCDALRHDSMGVYFGY